MKDKGRKAMKSAGTESESGESGRPMQNMLKNMLKNAQDAIANK